MPSGRYSSRSTTSRARRPPRSVDRREVLNGILYVLRNGCTWRALPHDLPPWGTGWWYFRT